MAKNPKPYTGKPRRDRFVVDKPNEVQVITDPAEQAANVRRYQERLAQLRASRTNRPH